MIYKEFREDGFPLCPDCGQDELYSTLLQSLRGTVLPSLEKILEEQMKCYYCGFDSLVASETTPAIFNWEEDLCACDNCTRITK